MARIRTHNQRRRRAHAREVRIAAFEYHMARCQRLEASGSIHKIRGSSWLRRWKKRVSQSVHAAEKPPERYDPGPDDLGNGGPMPRMFLNRGLPDNY